MEDERASTRSRRCAGKKFGVWIFGNEFEQRAALVKNGIDPDKDVTLVKQHVRHGRVPEAARSTRPSAMTYNELAQVLETKNPETGKLYTLDDLNVFKMLRPRHGHARRTASSSAATGSRTRRTRRPRCKFLEATFKGWIYCRDHLAECIEHRARRTGPALPQGHQTLADERGQRAHLAEQARASGSWTRSTFAQTAKIAKTYKVIKKPASKAAYRTDLAKKAVAKLKKQGVDVDRQGLQEEGRHPQGEAAK